MCEDKAIQLLAEVLNHVISLGLTVNEEVKADLLLETDYRLNLLLDEVLIFSLADVFFAKFSTSSSDFVRLLSCRGQDNG